MNSVIIIGDGLHSKLIASGFQKQGWDVLGTFGQDTELELQALIKTLDVRKISHNYHIAIGDNSRRSELVQKALYTNNYVSLVSTDAILESYSEIQIGSYIAPLSYIGFNSRIGEHSIVNTGAIIDHDVEVGKYSHIAGNSYIAGNVRIGERCLIGAGATVIEGLEIASDVIVGAGSLVIKSLDRPGTYVGSPVRFLQ
jgi:sugar O-acyltransferase (sialic acid O-acetyltransferase NeuD family)